MRYAIYDTKEQAEPDRVRMQAAADAAHIFPGKVDVMSYELKSGAYPGKWCVDMLVEIPMSGMMVDTLELPPEILI